MDGQDVAIKGFRFAYALNNDNIVVHETTDCGSGHRIIGYYR